MADPIERRSIAIDRTACIGSGNCLFYAGATFDLDAENRAMVIDPHGDDPDAQRMAVENCPSGALAFVD
jgi:ferredoxin